MNCQKSWTSLKLVPANKKKKKKIEETVIEHLFWGY